MRLTSKKRGELANVKDDQKRFECLASCGRSVRLGRLRTFEAANEIAEEQEQYLYRVISVSVRMRANIDTVYSTTYN